MASELISKQIRSLLETLSQGKESVDVAQEKMERLIASGPDVAEENSVRIDLDRQMRCGFPEVIYAPGKSNEQLRQAFEALLAVNQNCLATRCPLEQSQFLSETFPQAIRNDEARTVRINLGDQLTGRVAVVTAGTSDRPVALEAMETLRWMNVECELITDVGVAGPQRFLQVKDRLTNCQAVVVVAGMEGALPSVVAGWLDCPVIAVPTSVGYGAAFQGVAALLSMLNSCAANVAVVNIDAGFKGGFLAGMIATANSKHRN